MTPDPTFAFIGGSCCPTHDFVFVFNYDRVYTLLTSPSDIFIRTRVNLKKKEVHGKIIVKIKIMIISLLETGNNPYIKSEYGSLYVNRNTFACCFAKSRDLQ
jgi:hypothetical protein